MVLTKDRKVLEAEFHSQRELDRNRMGEEEFLKKYPNKSFYCIAKTVEDFREQMIQDKCRGGNVLDYCCGLGQASRRMAEYGPAQVYGIDISDQEIATCRKLTQEAGIDNCEFHVMDAENMIFPDNMFDVVVCNGVLHHLDVENAYKEISRVLKPGGIMVAHEALGYNPLIQLYRRLTPGIRTAWETDHILKISQVKQAEKYFKLSRIRFFYLFSIAAIPLRRSKLFKPLLSFLEMLDGVILRIPLVRLMAWQMVFVMKK